MECAAEGPQHAGEAVTGKISYRAVTNAYIQL